MKVNATEFRKYVEVCATDAGIDPQIAYRELTRVLTHHTPKTYKEEGLKAKCCRGRIMAEKARYANLVCIGLDFSNQESPVIKSTHAKWLFWSRLLRFFFLESIDRVFLEEEKEAR